MGYMLFVFRWGVGSSLFSGGYVRSWVVIVGWDDVCCVVKYHSVRGGRIRG